MDPLDSLRSHILALPDLAKFALVVAVIVGVPPLARRARLPLPVGLLLFGVLLGPHVLGLFGENRPIAAFFAELGKLLLMFSAGLEIDVVLFRKAQARSIAFGLITTTVPLLLGTAAGLAFGYGVIPAIVVGSLLASHTLLGLSIVADLGAMRLEPVVVTIGATVMSDTLSLIVFAVCVSTYTTGVLAVRAHPSARRDRRLRPANPVRAQPRRRLSAEQGGSRGCLFRPDARNHGDRRPAPWPSSSTCRGSSAPSSRDWR